jgi:hypothetical protein
MCPLSQVQSLSGTEIVAALGLQYSAPVVLFVLSKELLFQSKVLIRSARAVDAVPERFTEWRPDGPSPGTLEFVDADVPISAVREVRWCP